MGSIKTTQIDGDVSVGRNVSIGGDVDVSGGMTVGHNLKVLGWLDVQNVKFPSKGVFLSLADLESAYPSPADGCFAGVGESSPFDLYVARGGTWMATGETTSLSDLVNAVGASLDDALDEIDSAKSEALAEIEQAAIGLDITYEVISD